MARGAEAADDLAALLARATVVAVGPGLGQGAGGERQLEAALAFDGPLVVDADGLNLIAGRGLGDRLRARRAPTVLTPHPGEAGRLLGCSAREVEQDRFEAVRRIAAGLDAVVALKGAGTLVLAPGARPGLVSISVRDTAPRVSSSLRREKARVACSTLARCVAVGAVVVAQSCAATRSTRRRTEGSAASASRSRIASGSPASMPTSAPGRSRRHCSAAQISS